MVSKTTCWLRNWYILYPSKLLHVPWVLTFSCACTQTHKFPPKKILRNIICKLLFYKNLNPTNLKNKNKKFNLKFKKIKNKKNKEEEEEESFRKFHLTNLFPILLSSKKNKKWIVRRYYWKWREQHYTQKKTKF